MRTAFRCAAAIGLGLAAPWLSGCLQPKSDKPAHDPQTISAAYDDLRGATFNVVADFETPDPALTFGSADADARPLLSTKEARTETGSTSLCMTFNANSNAAWIDLPTNREHPDWSADSLLLFSVHTPQPIDGVRFELLDDADGGAVYEEQLSLRPGWNLVRVDLRKAARSVDLRHVHRLAWTLDNVASPAELHVDDIILVANRETITGSPQQDEQAGLYVTHEARRLHVGVPARFEIVFRHGVIAGWHDLESDPGRGVDLVRDDVLGPFPVPLESAADEAASFDPFALWAALGATPQTRQSLVEASPQRVVIEGEWRWLPQDAAPDAAASADAPAITWRYVITPAGRVFVNVACPTQAGTWRAVDAGLAVMCDTDAGFRPADVAADDLSASALLARPREGKADLLFVVHRAGGGKLVPIKADDDSRVGAMLREGLVAQPVQRWAVMLQIWPTDLDSRLAVDAIAADYGHPGAPHVEWGQAILTDAGDLDNDGYNESEGLFVVGLRDNTLRLTLNPEGELRFEPTLKIVDTANRDVSVYADGRIVRDTTRDADGNVVVRIADTISRPVLVEAHGRPRSGAPKNNPTGAAHAAKP